VASRSSTARRSWSIAWTLASVTPARVKRSTSARAIGSACLNDGPLLVAESPIVVQQQVQRLAVDVVAHFVGLFEDKPARHVLVTAHEVTFPMFHGFTPAARSVAGPVRACTPTVAQRHTPGTARLYF
jgi:hypothetical protein